MGIIGKMIRPTKLAISPPNPAVSAAEHASLSKGQATSQAISSGAEAPPSRLHDGGARHEHHGPGPGRFRPSVALVWPVCSAVGILEKGHVTIENQGEMAERVGFEPTVRLPVQRFSRPSRSTTPAPLRISKSKHLKPSDPGRKAKLQPDCNRKGLEHLLAEYGVDGICRRSIGALEQVSINIERDAWL
jgi:hypothetical protein